MILDSTEFLPALVFCQRENYNILPFPGHHLVINLKWLTVVVLTVAGDDYE